MAASSFFIQRWSPLGQVASLTYPCQTSDSVNCSDATRTIRYGYTNNQLTTMDDGTGASPSSWTPLLTGVTYYPNGMTATVTHGASSAAVTERWSADPFGMPRPSLIRATNASNTELWSTGGYAYDGAGNIKQIGGVNYSYDGSSRLTSATITTGTSAGASTSWQYDPFSNRLAISTRNCLSSGSVARCSSNSTQPLTITGTTNHIATATYDAAGNVLVDETGRSFAYDSLGMMKSASLPDGGSFRYLYSPDNERVAIVQRTLGGDSLLHNRTTWELRGFDNHLLRSYVDDEAHGPRTITRNEDELFRGALSSPPTPQPRASATPLSTTSALPASSPTPPEPPSAPRPSTPSAPAAPPAAACSPSPVTSATPTTPPPPSTTSPTHAR